ncbi:hypothetical protein HX045_09600 [Myroides odoratimimus]|uniref:hypothetical protein n=1 Tax=Myroides odoratimimus TaxID=76832 RepID=UPI0025771A7E|nr:hypothetical protein [Myroides odoratimimus]MDM1483937.1 hypothetical protein [Myroides odoratimimus]
MLDLISEYFHSLFREHPEYGGIGLVLIGGVLLFCSIKGYEHMYDQTGGPVFNMAWIRNTFGIKVAKFLNICFSILFILISIGFYFAYKK